MGMMRSSMALGIKNVHKKVHYIVLDRHRMIEAVAYVSALWMFTLTALSILCPYKWAHHVFGKCWVLMPLVFWFWPLVGLYDLLRAIKFCTIQSASETRCTQKCQKGVFCIEQNRKPDTAYMFIDNVRPFLMRLCLVWDQVNYPCRISDALGAVGGLLRVVVQLCQDVSKEWTLLLGEDAPKWTGILQWTLLLGREGHV